METVKKILEQYSLGEESHVIPVRESGDNEVYLVGDAHKRILRVSKRLPVEDVCFEHDAMEYLYENKFPVAHWVKTKNDGLYASTYDTSVAVMFDFIEGYHITIDKENLPSKVQAYTAGRTLGQMANIGRNFTSAAPRRRNIFIELERVMQNEDIFRKEFEGGDEFVEQIKDSLIFGKNDISPQGLIHNDYRAGNIFFKSDTEIAGVIDFDWCCIGPIAKDVALGILEWSFPDGRTEPDWEVFDSFLEGYNSISDDKQIKGENLYSWIKFAALSDVSTFFCDRLENPELKKKIARSYMYLKYLYFSKL